MTIFQHTVDKVLDGTKTKTCRIALPKPDGTKLAGCEMIGYPMGIKSVMRGAKDDSKWITRWQVGKTYAVQLGRGKKALHRRLAFDGNYEYSNGKPNEVGPARWHPVRIRILDIRRVDVRNMSDEDVKAEGFVSKTHFLLLWTKMHDMQFYQRFPTTGQIALALRLGALSDRPAERYDAWQLTFEVVA